MAMHSGAVGAALRVSSYSYVPINPGLVVRARVPASEGLDPWKVGRIWSDVGEVEVRTVQPPGGRAAYRALVVDAAARAPRCGAGAPPVTACDAPVTACEALAAASGMGVPLVTVLEDLGPRGVRCAYYPPLRALAEATPGSRRR
jgi:hypothetical protein